MDSTKSAIWLTKKVRLGSPFIMSKVRSRPESRVVMYQVFVFKITSSIKLLIKLLIQPIRVYFRPLKKGVVLPLAIVKKGRATPWTYKKRVATPWMCNQSLIKASGFYSIRCSTFTQTPKWSKEIDPPLSALLTLTHRTNNDDWRI